MNHDGKQEALGADQDVPFASSQFLAAVKPAHSSHQRFDRLTVNDCGAGSGVTSSMEAGQLPQLRMNADPRPIQPPLAEIPVNGLITNDKFCWTRRGALSLSWPRSRPLPRAWRQETPGSGYVPPDDRVSRHHRGGRYASSPSTLMAPAPSTGSSPRRTAALGSGVSAPHAVDSAVSANPASVRTGGGRQP
jgi:hypothetical protein